MSLRDRITALFRGPVTVAGPVSTSSLYRQAATYQFFDWMAGIPDPDEVLRRTGRTRANLRELMRDAELSQAMDTRREAVLATPWRLEPYKSRAEKFIYAELETKAAPLIAGLWDAVPYGYSVMEAIYTERAGRVGIESLSAPPFEWFKPMPSGGIRYFPQDGRGGAEGLDCPPVKFILATRGGNYRNPYGDSLLSSLYWPVTWRLQGWQLWLNFLETYSAPIIVGQTANYESFVDAMAKQGVARAVGWQSGGPADSEKITVINASAPGEFERLENGLNATIQKAVLGQTLTSDAGTNGSGSYALGKVHNEVRDDKRRADLRIVCAAGQQLVDNLWSLNRFPGDAPRFVMADDTGLEADRAERDAKLYTMGVRFEEKYIVERYDFNEGDIRVEAPQPATPMLPDGTPAAPTPSTTKDRANLSAAPRFTPAQQAVEDAIARVLKTGAPQAVTAAELRSVVMGATDQADLIERLALLVDKQDPAYIELLSRLQFAAHILGYVHALETPATP